MEHSTEWTKDALPLDSWFSEFAIRKEIPSITHEEYESMPYEKLVFFFGIIETLKEQERKAYSNKPHNIGRVRE